VKDHGAQAAELFSAGCNCAQAVLAAVAPELGVDQATALRLASGFGGGMGRLQKTCGVVTGSIMLLGLRYGMREASDQEAKKLCAEKVRELVAGFEARHGASDCRTLLGFDLRTPEGVARAHDVCGTYVEDGARVVAKMVRGQG
jgi:C_GCAxxG_C_C family probable redox protein